MRTLESVITWLLIAFGVLHLSLTRPVHPHIDIDAVWFASGGLLIVTIGTLNLLRVAYSSVAKGVYLVSAIANIVLLALMLVIATLLPLRSNPQVLIGLIVMALLTAFSLLRRAAHSAAHPMQRAK